MVSPELLAPAGTFEKMKTALLFGADAVYCGGEQFGLRAHAGNFTNDELAAGASYAHNLNSKFYVTVNVFARNDDFETLPEYLKFLESIDVDAIMVADPGIIQIARLETPDLPLFLSTQANCTNTESVHFWSEAGISRVILARELSLDEIREIDAGGDCELEVFVHGAICISYSGRCFISRYITGRDANRGECTHSCRWKYALQEEERPGEYMPIEEDGQGTYFFNAKDICLLQFIPDLMQIGIDAFKIEGRMKSTSYIASTVAVYREAIDTFAQNLKAAVLDKWYRELQKVSTRDFTEGFIRGEELPRDYDPVKAPRKRTHVFCAEVTGSEGEETVITVKNQFSTGESLEFLCPGCTLHTWKAEQVFSERDAEYADTVNPNDTCRLNLPFSAPVGSIVRVVRK